jgi:hypothetical protein
MKHIRTLLATTALFAATTATLCSQSAEVIANVPGPVFITYQHSRYHVVGSSYFYNRNWWNHDYWAIDVNSRPSQVTNFLSDNVQRFGNLPSYQRGGDDGYFVTTPTKNLPSGFQQDWIYAVYVDRSDRNNPTTHIAQFNPDGTQATPNWYTFANPSYNIRLAFDEVGTFGYNLLSAQYTNNQLTLRKHDTSGVATDIGTYDDLRVSSLLVVPNDQFRYGSLAGQLLATSTGASEDFITIDSNGVLQNWGSVGRNIATLSIAVGNVIYLADWPSNTIIELRAPVLDNYRGEIIGFVYDNRAPGSGIAHIYWDQATQSVKWDMILYFQDYGLDPKGATAVVVPEPSSLLALLMLSGMSARAFRRRARENGN